MATPPAWAPILTYQHSRLSHRPPFVWQGTSHRLLDFRNLIDVFQTHGADRLGSGKVRALQLSLLLFRAGSVEEEPRGCWRPQFEVEGSVGSHGDACGYRCADGDVSRAGIEFLCFPGDQHFTRRSRGRVDLAEVHGLHTLGSKSRTDRRRGTGLSCADDELDDLVLLDRFLCHGSGLSKVGVVG